MKTILFISLALISFSQTNAQTFTEGSPVNLDLITNFSHQLISESGEELELYIFIPHSTITGIQNILIIEGISDISVPSLINNDTIHIGDTVYTAINNENFRYTSSALEQNISYSIKACGTPQIAFESYPCGEFSWIMTLPENGVTIDFGYFYGNTMCSVNSIGNNPPPVDSISANNDFVTEYVSQAFNSIINESLSTQKLTTNASIFLYPNPVKNNITIDGLKISELTEIKIFNITGEMVKSLTSNEVKVNIDLSHLLNGVYLLEIAGNDGLIREKIIKE